MEEISTTLALGAILKIFWESYKGNLPYNTTVSISKILIERIKDEKIVNSDLQKSVHRSFIRALKSICEERLNDIKCAKYEQLGNFEWLGTEKWLNEKKSTLEKELKEVDKAEYVKPPIEELKEIELLLIPERDLIDSRFQTIKSKLIEKAIGKDEPPECYKKMVENTLFERVCFYFAYEIKNNEVVHNIFEGQLLAQIDINVESLVDHLLKVTQALPQLSEKLDRNYFGIQGINDKMLDVGQAIKNLPANIEEERDRKQKAEKLNYIFDLLDNKFKSKIKGNFLYKYDHSDNTDYLQLLSDDFRNLFFNLFYKHDSMCITGKRGAGKTFNCLLIGKKLQQEGYKVYYSSIEKAVLSDRIFIELKGLIDKNHVFIIDDCQNDLVKTEQILERANSIRNPTERPKLIFLTRPLDWKEMKEEFGEKFPVIEFKERYTDIKFLAELFFYKINSPEKLNDFLSLSEKNDISRALFRYKNMEFWNIFFNSIADNSKINMNIEDFYKNAYNFFSNPKKEQYLIKFKDTLPKLMPFFTNGMPVIRDYAENTLNISNAQIETLRNEGLIEFSALDWDKDWKNNSAIFIISKIHPTKAEILQILFRKYENIITNDEIMLTEYANIYYENLYRIIIPFYFHDPDRLKALCNNDGFILVLKKYFKERHLGKELDRVIKTLSNVNLNLILIDKIFDDDVMNHFVKECNNSKTFITGKLYLFRAIYKLSPLKAYELYENFDKELFINNFNTNPEDSGLTSLAKFMEIFKNIYYFVDENNKAQIVDDIKKILNGCSEKFIQRFEKHDYFTQFNWFLKRLDGIKLNPNSKASLANYFITKIPPTKMVEWIKNKDISVVELRYIFKIARFTFIRIDGTQKNLYHDYFKSMFDYNVAQKIFDNKRSKLYGLAITSKFSHEILSNYFYIYSHENSFDEMVSSEMNLYRINESLELVECNVGLSYEQKSFIIQKILKNCNFGKQMFKETIKSSKELGKEINIDLEKRRFLNFEDKYTVILPCAELSSNNP